MVNSTPPTQSTESSLSIWDGSPEAESISPMKPSMIRSMENKNTLKEIKQLLNKEKMDSSETLSTVYPTTSPI